MIPGVSLNLFVRFSVALSVALTATFISSCGTKTQNGSLPKGVIAQIELSNPTTFDRKDEPVFLEFNTLGLATDEAAEAQLAVRSGTSLLPSQLVDIDADGSKDGIMTLVDFLAAETRQIEVFVNTTDKPSSSNKRTQAEISHKQGGEWKDKKYIGGSFVNVTKLAPPPQYTDHSEFIRYEGPGIESDQIGYRIYLDWRNGFDIFGKKTNELALQGIGQDGYDSYHEMADWGMDILKVGDALGMGGYGYWNGKKVERVSKVDNWEATIVENGDIYSSLKIEYKGWEIADKKIDLTAILSMTAGSRLVKVNLETSESISNIAIGLVKHKGTNLSQGGTIVAGHAQNYVSSYGQQSLNKDNLGMALLFKRRDHDAQLVDEHNYVSVMSPTGSNKLEYHFLAAWELEPNGIKNEQEFIQYLEQESVRLTQAPRLRIISKKGLAAKQLPVTAESALAWSKKMADSVMTRGSDRMLAYGGYDSDNEQESQLGYTTSLLMQAYDDLSAATGDQKYARIGHEVIGSFIADNGDIRSYDQSSYNIDNINAGKMMLRLYEDTKEEKFKIAASHLRHQLENHPRTSEGAFWHKKRYPYQVWLDGVYMGMPFLAHYSDLFENGASLEEAVNEFVIVRKYNRDEKSGLYWHGWDENKVQDWADPGTGSSKHFWGRGLGWFAMALVDILDHIPAEKQELRKPILDILQELAPAIVKFQDQDSGVWYQILDLPDREGNYLESSGSGMFVYALAKAINKGYLPNSYKEATVKGYNGLIREFINVRGDDTVALTNICLVAGLGYGRDGSFNYYMSEPVVTTDDPKGIGPFIMAGIQINELLK